MTISLCLLFLSMFFINGKLCSSSTSSENLSSLLSSSYESSSKTPRQTSSDVSASDTVVKEPEQTFSQLYAYLPKRREELEKELKDETLSEQERNEKNLELSDIDETLKRKEVLEKQPFGQSYSYLQKRQNELEKELKDETLSAEERNQKNLEIESINEAIKKKSRTDISRDLQQELKLINEEIKLLNQEMAAATREQNMEKIEELKLEKKQLEQTKDQITHELKQVTVVTDNDALDEKQPLDDSYHTYLQNLQKNLELMLEDKTLSAEKRSEINSNLAEVKEVIKEIETPTKEIVITDPTYIRLLGMKNDLLEKFEDADSTEQRVKIGKEIATIEEDIREIELRFEKDLKRKQGIVEVQEKIIEVQETQQTPSKPKKLSLMQRFSKEASRIGTQIRSAFSGKNTTSKSKKSKNVKQNKVAFPSQKTENLSPSYQSNTIEKPTEGKPLPTSVEESNLKEQVASTKQEAKILQSTTLNEPTPDKNLFEQTSYKMLRDELTEKIEKQNQAKVKESAGSTTYLQTLEEKLPSEKEFSEPTSYNQSSGLFNDEFMKKIDEQNQAEADRLLKNKVLPAPIEEATPSTSSNSKGKTKKLSLMQQLNQGANTGASRIKKFFSGNSSSNAASKK